MAETKKHLLVCPDCYNVVAELLEEEVGPGHRKIEEDATEIRYVGCDLCEDCEEDMLT